MRLSDLPARFTLVPGETHPTPLTAVLAEPRSAGVADVIRREHVAGYQTAFQSPEAGTLQCTAAVYRSVAGARDVFRHQARHFTAFAASRARRARRVERIGDETRAFTYTFGSANGLTMAWRYHNIVASCISVSHDLSDLALLTRIGLAQQARIAAVTG